MLPDRHAAGARLFSYASLAAALLGAILPRLPVLALVVACLLLLAFGAAARLGHELRNFQDQ
jgi:hypothetical protein